MKRMRKGIKRKGTRRRTSTKNRTREEEKTEEEQQKEYEYLARRGEGGNG